MILSIHHPLAAPGPPTDRPVASWIRRGWLPACTNHLPTLINKSVPEAAPRGVGPRKSTCITEYLPARKGEQSPRYNYDKPEQGARSQRVRYRVNECPTLPGSTRYLVSSVFRPQKDLAYGHQINDKLGNYFPPPVRPLEKKGYFTVSSGKAHGELMYRDPVSLVGTTVLCHMHVRDCHASGKKKKKCGTPK